VFSSKSPSKLLLVLPGIAVFAIVFWLRSLLPQGSYRGASILFSFAVICIVINGLARQSVGLGFRPTVSVWLTSLSYGALFWGIDSFVVPERFDALLGAIKTDTQKIEKLKILYEHTKNTMLLVGGLVIAVCVTLAWNISSVIGDKYESAGLSGPITTWTVWLVFWWGLGVAGGIGSEIGRRQCLILNSLTLNNSMQE
jgi:hypothetical protein